MGGEVRLHSFFSLGIKWRRVVSFMIRALLVRGKSPRYSLNGKVGELQRLSGRFEGKK